MRTSDFTPGLNHQCFFVRSEALHVIATRPDAEVEATAAALDAIIEWGWTGAFEFSHELRSLPLDQEQSIRVVDLIFGKQVASLETEPHILPSKWHLASWVAQGAPVECLEQLRDLIQNCDTDKDEFETIWRKLIELRISYASSSASETIESLNQLIAECKKAEEFPHDATSKFGFVAQRLKNETSHFPNSKLENWLATDPDSKECWRIGFAIQLATVRQLKEFSPKIIELLSINWDWLDEQVLHFHSETIDRDGILNLTDLFSNSSSESEQLFLSGAIENAAPFANLEKPIGNAINQLQDPMAVVSLALYLARLGTNEATQIASQAATDLEGFPDAICIIKTLYAVQVLCNGPAEEIDRYKNLIKSDFERSKQAKQDMQELFTTINNRSETFKSGTKKLTSMEPELAVGRNQPCPCGSGHKYKMCCLKKAG